MTILTLGGEEFISISTLKRDGTTVATPMWVVESDGHLYIWTGDRTGKVKRIRNNPKVTLAPCTRTGKLTGDPMPAVARIVATSELPHLWRLFPAKYGWQLRLILTLERVSALLRIGPFHKQGERVYVELSGVDG